MIKGEDFGAKAAELLTLGNIPYKDGGMTTAGMDCQGLVRWVMQALGLALPAQKGANYMWRNCLTEKGTIEECVQKWGVVPIGTLIFIRAFDGGEVERGYNDAEGNAWHVYVKMPNGKLVHASAGNGGVVERDFADKIIKNGGPNTYGMLAGVAYTGAKGAVRVEADEYPQPTPDVSTPELGPGYAMVNTKETGLMLWKEPREPKKGERAIKEMPKGHIVKVLGFYGDWVKVQFVDFRGTRHVGWSRKQYLKLG